MEPEIIESAVRERVAAERKSIVPPPTLERRIMHQIEATPAVGGSAGRLRQLTLTLAMLTLAVAVALGVIWLRSYRHAAPSVDQASPTPAADQASPMPFTAEGTVPDASAGSAIGYYEPGGYPILVNQQFPETGPKSAVSTTWKWDGTRWLKLLEGNASPYAGTNMAYDPALKMTILLHGTRTLGWNGSKWVDVSSAPFSDAYLAFDQGRNQLVALVSTSGPPAAAVTWVYDGSSWKQVNSTTGPAGHFRSGFAYDPRNGTIVLFGGSCSGGFCYFDDTWLWNGTAWTQLHPVTSPPKGLAAMAYDPVTKQMILLAQDGTVWNWSGTNWTRVESGAAPPYGSYAGLVYDSARKNVLLWQGVGRYEMGSQTWTYSAGQWSRRSMSSPEPTPTPPPATPAPTAQPLGELAPFDPNRLVTIGYSGQLQAGATVHYYVGYGLSKPGGEDMLIRWAGLPVNSYSSTLIVGEGRLVRSGDDGRSVIWHLTGHGWIDVKLEIGTPATGQLSVGVRGVNDASYMATQTIGVPQPEHSSLDFHGALTLNGPTQVRPGQQATYRIAFTSEVRFGWDSGPRFRSYRFIAGSGQVVNDSTSPAGVGTLWWNVSGPGEIEVTFDIPSDVKVSRFSLYVWIGGTGVCCSGPGVTTEVLR
jgi:hypothetical protein